MKRILLPLVGVLFVIFSGCKPNGTATGSSTEPGDKDKVRKLTIKSPGDQAVKQNATAEISISIDRDNFKGPVAVELKNLPPGVAVATQDMTIMPDKDSIKVAVKANADAKVADNFKVTAWAKAKEEKDMKEATTDFNLSVKPKE